MTPMIKAPDPGVVKSLAKALRKNLPETVTSSPGRGRVLPDFFVSVRVRFTLQRQNADGNESGLPP